MGCFFKSITLGIAVSVSSMAVQGQFTFKDDLRIPCTDVKNQQMTGTCWSFGTTSFLESEVLRIKKSKVNLSEMYSVRINYISKALNYVLRQGKANFGEGGVQPDVLNVVAQFGMMPQEAFSGKTGGDTIYNHSELQPALTAFLDAIIKAGRPTVHWMPAFNGILDAYMGVLPAQFSFQGKNYTSQTFRDAMGIDARNYVSLTSFTHHPYYQSFILEVPDNYANNSYFNVKLDELVKTVDFALEHGYSIAWDADVSEKGFSGKESIAILPVHPEKENLFANPGEELQVTETNRQENFMNYKTTDDHIMHLIGRAFDQNGKKYYIIKNSWGSHGPYQGYYYISEAFFKMKTISVVVHKEGVPKELTGKMAGN